MGIDELNGLWRRSLLLHPDGSSDRTSIVRWLQGPSLYADLRQPDARVSFAGVRCLRDLERPQIEWMSRQEAFAGRLGRAGECFLWNRDVDFQPETGMEDAGILRRVDGMMEEVGRDQPYTEHWHPVPVGKGPSGALFLHGQEGRAVLVAVGERFMHARSRPRALPTGRSLADLVSAAPGIASMQDLVDCEVSYGRRDGDKWRISRSTLPFLEGRDWTARAVEGGEAIDVEAMDPEGRPLTRRWAIMRREGEIDVGSS